MESVLSYALNYYKSDKPVLKLQQKLLYVKYFIALKRYTSVSEQISSKENLSIDDLIIMSQIYKIHASMLDSFDENFVLDIDKNKYEETKKLIADEISRLKSLIDKIISSAGSYVPNYSNEELEKYLRDDINLDEIIKLNNQIKESNFKTNNSANITKKN